MSETPREKIFALEDIGDSVGKKVIEMLETGEMKMLNGYLVNRLVGLVPCLL